MFEKFIKATDSYTDKDNHVPAPYIRRGFCLDFIPEAASVRICTGGFYELFINGKKITKGFLAPYISNPDDFVCYDEYDITKELKIGKNAIGIILGNGFANQSVYHWDFGYAPHRAPLSVSAQLTASCFDKSFSLSTDESFKTAPSPITYDMYRYGTHYDARLEIPGWCSPDFDDSSWDFVTAAPTPKGEIVPCTAEPITLQYELSPVSIKKDADFCYLKTAFRGGEDVEFSRVKEGYIYDFGASHSGVCKLKMRGEAGQKITLRHGEKLTDDGKFTLNSIYTYSTDYIDFIPNFQTDVYILKSGECEIYVPSFTYHGFRYVLVEGIDDSQATEDLLRFEVFNSSIKKRSHFTCSNDTINKLYAMTINAGLSNFHYFPTDCPHREKNGWTGDVSVSAEHMMLSFDCRKSMKLWLKSLRHSQCEDGMLPAIAPTSGWGYTWGNGPFWDAVCVNLPYCVYKYDGDITVLSENAEMIYRYLKYISAKRDENGLIAKGLGDWVQPKIREFGIRAPLLLTDSATIYDISKKAAKIFDILGLCDERDYAKNLANELRASIREHLIDKKTMTASGECQTSQAYLLYLGIFENDEIDEAVKRLIEIIRADGEHLFCGMIGLRCIFEVLFDNGYADLAIKMITRPDAPSYASMIERGATALCESLEENGWQESENHHFFGDIIRIFISYLAGIKINPTLSNKNSLIFEPTLTDSIDSAFAEYSFDCGKAFGGWERSGCRVRFYITLPVGACGSFRYHGITRELLSGYNEFVM